MSETKSVLILGGTGQAGGDTAALLRRWYPALPLTIAGRDLERARRAAGDLGNASAVTTDLARADLGLPDGTEYAAVVAALWDKHLNGLRFAQDHGLPYLSISNALVDVPAEVVAGGRRPRTAPVLLASHCLAGLIPLAALYAARDFAAVDTIRVGALMDELDSGGPAAIADLERWFAGPSAGLVRRDGIFTWVSGADAAAEVTAADGTVVPGQSTAVLDVPSLALATGAPNVRFDLAIGETSSRRRGGPPSMEVGIDLTGTDSAGTPRTAHHRLTHPAGQRPLTSLTVALGVQRLLGLRGDPAAPGIYTPEGLIEPAHAVAQLRKLGGTFEKS